MTIFTKLEHSFSRCFLIVLSCISLNAYSDTLNGVGGTGISTTVGPVTAFGSVSVNGIYYNTDNAKFLIKGEVGQQDDIDLGNIIKVIGTTNDDKKTGVAKLITYSDTITGPITLKANNKNSIEVMRQTVVTDEMTQYHGFIHLTDLNTGYIVEVSGLSESHGKIKATSIRLVNKQYVRGNRLKIYGSISNINQESQTFSIQDLIINYAKSQFTGIKPNELKSGLYLNITTNQNIQNNTLSATNIGLDSDIPPDIDLYGNEIFLRTTLQSIDLAKQTIEILGQTAHINTSTLLSDDRLIDSPALSLEDFSVGDFVLVVVKKDSIGQIDSLRLSKIEAMTDTFIAGLPDAIDEELGTLRLFNQTIYTDKTKYFGIAQDSIFQDTFFSSISGLQTKLRVTGRIKPNGTLDATRLELSNQDF